MFSIHKRESTPDKVSQKGKNTKKKYKLLRYPALILSILIACSVVTFNQWNVKATGSYSSAASALLKSEMALCKNISDKFMKSTQTLPFTFLMNNKKIRGIPSGWKPVMTIKPADSNVVKTTIRGTDPATKLKVTYEMTTYKDYPVVEWIVWFENTGKSKSPLISDIYAIDSNFDGSTPILTQCNGDFNSAEGYTVKKSKLAGQTLSFEPTGGRPCDSAFPYYRLNFKDYGITMAIGWPCQWVATFTGTTKSVSIKSGQGNISAKLNPGEKIRAPRMTLLTYKNGEDNGINVWRSWFRDHILIKPDGNNIKPMFSGYGPADQTEAYQLNAIDKLVSKGYNFKAFWMDAGWYPLDYTLEKGNEWYATGNWYPDPVRYPDGMKIISDKVHKAGAKFLMWFEPERVYKGTQTYNELTQKHPGWLLKGSSSSLLNMGIPACREWITNKVDKMIKDFGVDIYRQDYNYYSPLDLIQSADKDNRYGMTENLYVQGYLQFWDDLLARNPGLIIDSCASGARRDDLETMRRSVPLHYSDYGYGNTLVRQSFHDTLYQWFPYFKDTTMSDDFALANSIRDKDNQLVPGTDVDTFAAYVGIAPFYCNIDINNDNYDFNTFNKILDAWNQVSQDLVDGDYYLLTTDTRKDTMWTVRQFDLPSSGEGVFQLFRNVNNNNAHFAIHPKGAINPELTYEINNLTSGTKTVIKGSDWLKNGFTVTLGRREACLIKYKVISN